MATRFLIPRVLQSYCKGKAELLLHGATVRELLNDLQRETPSLYQCICDERGMIRKHVNLFINNEFLAEREGLDTSLQSEDVISVFQAVSGG